MKKNYFKSCIPCFLKFLFLANVFFLLLSDVTVAQYATRHHIAPAPWQFTSNANQLVITTETGGTGPAVVSVKKSDGTLIATLTVSSAEPTLYRFDNLPLTAEMMRNVPNTKYTDRGLIIESTRPVSVNIRNIMSDDVPDGLLDTEDSYIKGNSSFLSFGLEAAGRAFRLGYYRDNWEGLNHQFDASERDKPVFSVMAIDNNTQVELDGAPLITLNAGESYLFFADMGALLTSDRSIVANAGAWRDAPGGCGDGVVSPVAPNRVLGSNYIVVRGKGDATLTDRIRSEQTTVVASEAGTSVTIVNYDENGAQIGTTTTVLANAGDHYTFFHGDGESPYSSSIISSSSPVIVYTGTAQGCEVDMSTVTPIGGCSGSNYLQTSKYITYGGSDLPYFGYIMVQSPTDIVYLNDVDIESLGGVGARIPIGSTGNYLFRFENWQIGDPETLTLRSNSRMTVSMVQQGAGFSMSSFISSFTESITPPRVDAAGDCIATLIAPDAGLEPYQWYFNGVAIPGATERTYSATESGNYAVSGTKECGVTRVSEDVYVDVCTVVPSQPRAVDDTAETAKGQPVDIPVLENDEASDSPLDPGSIEIVTPPQNGTAEPQPDGTVRYTPDPDFVGEDTFTYIVRDEDGNPTGEALVTVTVVAAPVANDDQATTRQSVPVTIDILENDEEGGSPLDPGSVALVDPETGDPVQQVTIPGEGTYEVNEDGTVTFTPEPQFNGESTIDYIVQDEDGIPSNPATITVTVTPTQPVAVDDDAETAKGQSVDIPVLDNDEADDSPLDPESIEIVTPPQHGTAEPQPDGTIRYTPDPDFVGEDTFTYIVRDGNGNPTGEATVTVTVVPPPTANDDQATTKQPVPVTINILENDEPGNSALDPGTVSLIDPETGDPVQEVTIPNEGTYQVNEDGTVTFTPEPLFSGESTVDYFVRDVDGVPSNPATIAVTVTPTQPEAVDDAAETGVNRPVDIPVLDNDVPDDSPLDPGSIEIVDAPRNGTAVPQPDGTIRYTPNPGFVGEDTFTYQVRDENGNVTNEATVTITVNENPLHIPNVFTPNGDGYHDYFVITGAEGYDRVELLVVNRWGNEVYKNSDYRNNWEGNGLNEGTYFYRIYLYAGQNREEYKGPVLIKR